MMKKIILAVIVILTTACGAIAPAPTPTPTKSQADQLWTSVAAYCGFRDDGGMPDGSQIGPGNQYPMKIWEEWHVVSSDDANPTNRFEPAVCRRTFEIDVHADGALGTWPEWWVGTIVITISPEGTFAEVLGEDWFEEEPTQNQLFDQTETNQLLHEQGLEWIYELDLQFRTVERKFWIDRQTGEIIDQGDIYGAVGDYCEKYGFLSHWEWELEEDLDPTDRVVPAVCYLDFADVEIWVNLETLEVTPRK